MLETIQQTYTILTYTHLQYPYLAVRRKVTEIYVVAGGCCNTI